jgi:hypothetical protein
MRSIVLASAVALSCTTAQADPEILGAGIPLCSQYVTVHQQHPELADMVMMNWVQGFLIGYNAGAIARGQGRNVAGKSIEQKEQEIRLFCNQHPSSDIVKGALDLYQSLPNPQ